MFPNATFGLFKSEELARQRHTAVSEISGCCFQTRCFVSPSVSTILLYIKIWIFENETFESRNCTSHVDETRLRIPMSRKNVLVTRVIPKLSHDCHKNVTIWGQNAFKAFHPNQYLTPSAINYIIDLSFKTIITVDRLVKHSVAIPHQSINLAYGRWIDFIDSSEKRSKIDPHLCTSQCAFSSVIRINECSTTDQYRLSLKCYHIICLFDV